MFREPHTIILARERQRELLREAENARLARALTESTPRRDRRVAIFGRSFEPARQA